MATPVDFSKFQSDASSFGPSDIKFLEKALNSTKCKINFNKKNSRSTSAFGKDKDHCLCKVLRPVIILCQLAGIMPVSHDRDNCKMKHDWISFPALINVGWIGGNFFGIYFGVATFKQILGNDLSGIDNYAFQVVMAVQFAATMTMFLSGNLMAPRFLKAWAELHSATEEIAMPNFQRVRCLIYLLPVFLTQEMVVNTCIYSWVMFSSKMSYDSVPVGARLGSFITNVIPNLVTGIYCVLLVIISQNFKTINNNLVDILEKQEIRTSLVKYWNPLLHLQIARYRILHEKLCRTIRLLESAFGIQILAVVTATCISFVAGIYGLIIGTQGLAPTKVNSLIIGFGLSTMVAAVRVLVIISFSENLMNEANGTAHILNNANSEILSSEDVNNQVEKFLQKLGNFPLQIKCCNMFALGNSFYGSAVSTVVTYVLILFQFRN